MLALLLVVFCFYSFYSKADTSSTTTQNLNNGTITNPNGGCPAGTTAMTKSSSTVRWGECANIYAISFAINQALTQAGISVDKAHYSWRYIHCFNKPGTFCNTNISDRVNTSTGEITDDTYWDVLSVVVTITDDEGNVKQTKTWTMDKWYDYLAANPHSSNEVKVGNTYWQVHEDFIELFDHTNMTGTIMTPSDLGSMSFTITGQDKGEWDGYYGPILTTLQTYFTYRTNPCTADTLYHSTCPGYAEAYAQQQYNQQCTANPLYDAGCPGYAAALYTQQCTANPLYDAGCPGYADAYYTQQCELDPLYDKGCTGYDNAYLLQQCTLDATYDKTCDGYFEARCEQDALYDVLCTGYDTAYFNQQCLLNPQYDSACPGYVAPVDAKDPVKIADGTSTGDSTVDEVLEVPTLPVIEIVEVPVVTKPEPEPEPEPEIVEEVVVEETVEQEVAVEETVEEVAEVVEKKKPVTKKQKAKAKRKKLKAIAQKRAKSLAEQMSDAASFEVQQKVQQQLITMLSFVPDFSKYSRVQLDGGQLPKEVNLKGGRIVDHQFARWFVNDPNYERLEELQYNLEGKTIWQK